MRFRCTCGMEFDKSYKLQNHVGYAILRDDNKDGHKPDEATREWLEQYMKDNKGHLP